MPIELRQLRYFNHLADELSFSRAAGKANISQSSMTEQIQRLEDVLGVRLADRTRRSVRLTLAGELLRGRSSDILKQVELIVEETRRAGGLTRARLRLGYSEMALSSPMPKIVQNFRHRYPEVEVVLLEQSSTGSEKALIQGAFDCLFVPNARAHPLISSLNIGSDPILVCMASSSRLLDRSVIRIPDFQDEAIILPEEGNKLADFILAAFAIGNVRPRVIARIGRASSILTLVAAEEGAGFIPLSLAGLVPQGVVMRPFGDPALSIPFSLLWRSEPDNPLVTKLVEIARDTREPLQK